MLCPVMVLYFLLSIQAGLVDVFDEIMFEDMCSMCMLTHYVFSIDLSRDIFFIHWSWASLAFLVFSLCTLWICLVGCQTSIFTHEV